MIAQPDHKVNAPARSILLASASPRRRELITLLGLPVVTMSVDIDEVPLPGERADAMALRLSQVKAQVAAALVSRPSSFILLASDTVVALDDEPLGKPRDADDARSMLQRLRGRTHQVYTAITLLDLASNRILTDLACSDVPMRRYTDAEIEAYIASGDPFDKAGAYAIQHNGFHPVEHFQQCFANVMGLPLCHTVRTLRRWGIEPLKEVPVACQRHIGYTCPVYESILTSELTA